MGKVKLPESQLAMFHYLRLNNFIFRVLSKLYSEMIIPKIPNQTHFFKRRMEMTMPMMKTTAKTGPTTQMSPSPVSTGKGSTTNSGVITVSVNGLVANIF